jgi:Flp pilus assembly protein TadG
MNSLSSLMKRRENGSVAVELALVLGTILLPLLAAALFFGRLFWHYTVAEKAAHDAARFLAAASPTELKTQCQNPFYDACVVSAARALARAEVAELNPGPSFPQVTIECDDEACLASKTSPLPKMINVHVHMTVEDPFFTPITSLFTGDMSSIAIQIDATGRSYYVGN